MHILHAHVLVCASFWCNNMYIAAIEYTYDLRILAHNIMKYTVHQSHVRACTVHVCSVLNRLPTQA